VSVHDGKYDSVPLEEVNRGAKSVDVERFYRTDRLRPRYTSFEGLPVFIMTADA
jgi:ATP-dependent phosphofructokinase / diphosphate-dependent phosphofructokinase